MRRIRLNSGLLDIPLATPPDWTRQYVTALPLVRTDSRLSIFHAVALAAQIREQEAARRAAARPPTHPCTATRRRRRISWGEIAARQELARALK
ncbi:hypothetical protein PUN4_290002 [Paraburkholderia unamae]|uniref:hypothetical protein n=1 Tax=Paraburkholderia unamae TaxID=219649 RepID=UPI001CAE648A|nr:hypothetical protein [Paraburkholderia unamae]CAG9257943.1 hypothetical protein PUN4_290002 [Paraburkholderia unamae]